MGIIAQLFGTGKVARPKEVARLYELYRQPFVSFLRKHYAIDEETAYDLYQESFTDLCQNVQTGRYTEGQASLRTYLFEIGKRKACNWLRRNRMEPEEKQNLFSEWLEAQETSREWAEAQEITTRLLQETEEICRKVLTLFYWERLSMAEIAARMNYKDADVAKNKKSSCLRRLTFELQRRLEAADIHWKRKEKK